MASPAPGSSTSNTPSVFRDALDALSGPESHATRYLAIIGALGLLLGAVGSESFIAHVSISPSNFLAIWAFLTSSLIESNLLVGVVFLAAVLTFMPSLQKHWGLSSVLRFLISTTLITNFLVYVLVLLAFGISESERILNFHVFGFSGILTSLAMVLKQRSPEAKLVLTESSADVLPSASDPSGRGSSSFVLLHKHFPIVLWLSAVFILCIPLLSHVFAKDAVLVICSTFASWLYLRFFFLRDKQVGDSSDAMAFVTLLPDIGPLRTYASIPVDALYSCVTYLGLLTDRSRLGSSGMGHHGMGSVLNEAGSIGLKTTSPTTQPLLHGYSNSISTSPSSSSSSSSRHPSHFSSSSSSSSSPGGTSISPLPSSLSVVPTVDPAAERRKQLAMRAIDEKLAALSSGTRQPGHMNHMNNHMNNHMGNGSSVGMNIPTVPGLPPGMAKGLQGVPFPSLVSSNPGQ